MAVDITYEVNLLRTATYGEEVRGSIADALTKLQNGVNQSSGRGNASRVGMAVHTFRGHIPIGKIVTKDEEVE